MPRVGTIFAELDLDFAKFARKEQQISISAKKAAGGVEKDWDAVGANLNTMYDVMAKKVEVSYAKITASIKKSAISQEQATAEQTRAAIALENTLARLDKKRAASLDKVQNAKKIQQSHLGKSEKELQAHLTQTINIEKNWSKSVANSNLQVNKAVTDSKKLASSYSVVGTEAQRAAGATILMNKARAASSSMFRSAGGYQAPSLPKVSDIVAVDKSLARVGTTGHKSMSIIAAGSNTATKSVKVLGTTGKKSMSGITAETEKTTQGMTGLSMVLVKNYLAYLALQTVMGGTANEFRRAFAAVDDFKVAVASTAGFITTFSEKAAMGDIAGGFEEAYAYSELLNAELEKMDALTIANGEDLKLISQAFIKNGVLLDVNNAKQKQGFLAIATALKALFANTANGQLQMNQEITALMAGQVRAGDKLAQILKAKDPLLLEHLRLWKSQGTVIENIGRMLGGFTLVAGKLEGSWATIGSTLETIHTRILRGAFKPVMEDILGIAISLRDTLIDSEGGLTEEAMALQEHMKDAYEITKDLAESAVGMVATWAAIKTGVIAYQGYVKLATADTILLNTAASANVWVAVGTAAVGSFILMKEHLQNLTDKMIKAGELSNDWFQAPEGFDVKLELQAKAISDKIKEIEDVQKNGIFWELGESADRVALRVKALNEELDDLLGLNDKPIPVLRDERILGLVDQKSKSAPKLHVQETPEAIKARLDAYKSYEDAIDSTLSKEAQAIKKTIALYDAKREAVQKIYDVYDVGTEFINENIKALDALDQAEKNRIAEITGKKKPKDDESAAAQRLLDTLLPLEAEQKKYQADLAVINKLHEEGTLVGERYNTALSNLEKSTSGYKDRQKEAANGVKELTASLHEQEAALQSLEDYISQSSSTESAAIQAVNAEYWKMIDVIMTLNNTDVAEKKLKQVDAAKDSKISGIKSDEANAADDKLLQDKMSLYKDLAGFEDEYRETQLEWIKKIRLADIEATDDVAAANKKAAESIAKVDQASFEAKSAQVNDALGQMGSIFDSIGSMYDKSSDEYAKMQEASKAMMVLQQGVAVVDAVVAVANQASGDPYTAFGRMAAMAAAMGGLLGSIGVGFGGSGTGTVVAPPPPQGAGSVLGDPDALSESASKSFDMLEEFHDLEYGELTKIYNEMRDLNTNITGVVNSVVRGIDFNADSGSILSSRPGEFESLARAMHSIPVLLMEGTSDFLSDVLGDTVGGIASIPFDIGVWALDALDSAYGAAFGGGQKTWDAGTGLVFGDVRISDSLAGIESAVDQFARTTTKTDGGYFNDSTYSTNYQYSDVADDTQRLFDQVYSGLSGSIVSLAEGLGGDVNEAMEYVFSLGYIDFKDKTADEIGETLSAMISKAGDDAADDILGNLVDLHQAPGEGPLETVTRLYRDQEVALAVLRMNSQDIAASIDINALGIRNQGFDEGFVSYSDSYFKKKNAEDLVAATQALIDFSGGLQEFVDISGTYYDKFTTDQEKLKDLTSSLSFQFDELGISMPNSREQFTLLVESLDITTEAGQRAYVSLLGMASGVDEFYKGVEDAYEVMDNTLPTLTKYKEAITEIDKQYRDLYFSGAINGSDYGRLWDSKGIAIDDIITDMMSGVAEINRLAETTDMERAFGDLNDWYQLQVDNLESVRDQMTGNDYDSYFDDINYAAANQAQTLIDQYITPQTKAWEDWINGITLSDLAPVQSAEAFTGQYEDLLAASGSGESADIQNLLNYVKSDYLPFLQSYGGSDYATAYDNVLSDISGKTVEIGSVKIDPDQLAPAIAQALAPYITNSEGGNLTVQIAIGEKDLFTVVANGIRSDTELISAVQAVPR